MVDVVVDIRVAVDMLDVGIRSWCDRCLHLLVLSVLLLVMLLLLLLYEI